MCFWVSDNAPKPTLGNIFLPLRIIESDNPIQKSSSQCIRHFIKNDFKRKVRLYDLKEKQPESKIAKRCLDFKKLEEVAKVFKKEK